MQSKKNKMSENHTYNSEIIFAISTIAATFAYTFLRNFSRAATPINEGGFMGGSLSNLLGMYSASSSSSSPDLFSNPLVQGLLGFSLFTVLAASSQIKEFVAQAQDLYLRHQNLASLLPTSLREATARNGGRGGSVDYAKLLGLGLMSIVFILRKIDPRPAAEQGGSNDWPRPSTIQWFILVVSLIFVFLLLSYCMKTPIPTAPPKKGIKAPFSLTGKTTKEAGSYKANNAANKGFPSGTPFLPNLSIKRTAATLERVTVDSCTSCLYFKRMGYLGLGAALVLSAAVGILFYTSANSCPRARADGTANLPTWAWAAILAASLPCLVHFNPYQS